MRVLLAGLFVFVGLLLGFSFLSSVLPKSTPPLLMGIIMAVFMLILCIGCLVLFNLGKGQKSVPDAMENLKKQGLIESRQYEATWAFEVEEFEDEGAQYFIELKDGSVLFLCGQYLYDYAPADGKFEKKCPRTFPCSKFTLLRHKEEGFVLDVICEGEVIEPEFKVPHFGAEDFGTDQIPEDGQIISGKTYEQIRAEHSKRV